MNECTRRFPFISSVDDCLWSLCISCKAFLCKIHFFLIAFSFPIRIQIHGNYINFSLNISTSRKSCYADQKSKINDQIFNLLFFLVASNSIATLNAKDGFKFDQKFCCVCNGMQAASLKPFRTSLSTGMCNECKTDLFSAWIRCVAYYGVVFQLAGYLHSVRTF